MTAVTKSFGICPSGIDRPAAFCLEYRDVDGSTRVRSIKVSEPSEDLDELTLKVIRSFPRYIPRETVSTAQVYSLLKRLVGAMSAAAPAVQRQGSASEAGDEEDILDLLGDEEEAVDKAEVDAYEIDAMKDLNKVSDHELAVAKRKMDMAFEERRLRPGDPGFVYDKKVDFQPTASDAGSWESEEDDSEGGEDGEKEGEDEGEAAMNTATGAATERTAAAWEEGVQEIGEGHEERAGVDTGDSDRAGEVPGAKERGEAMGELSAGSEASVELDESVDDASSFSSVGVDRKEAEVGAGDTGTAVGVAGVEGLGGGGGGFNDDMAIRGGADELDELDELDDYGEDFDDADDVLDLPGLGDGGEGIRDDIDELDELPELPDEDERLDSDIGMSSLERWEGNLDV